MLDVVSQDMIISMESTVQAMGIPKVISSKSAVAGTSGADLCNARAVVARRGPYMIAAFSSGKLALYDALHQKCAQLYVDPGEDDAGLAGQVPFGHGTAAGLAGAVIPCARHDCIISVAGHDDGGLSLWCSLG